MSDIWRKTHTEPLTELESLAAQLLADLYVARVQHVVAAQVQGVGGRNLQLTFTEPDEFQRVVSVLNKARALGVHEAASIALHACDEHPARSREHKIVRAAPAAEEPRDPEKWPCTFGHHPHKTREEAVECARQRIAKEAARAAAPQEPTT